MANDTSTHHLKSESLAVHFALKERGSSFSDVARRASKGGHQVTPFNVRGVIYGYMQKNSQAIWRAINDALAEAPAAGQKLAALMKVRPKKRGRNSLHRLAA